MYVDCFLIKIIMRRAKSKYENDISHHLHWVRRMINNVYMPIKDFMIYKCSQKLKYLFKANCTNNWNKTLPLPCIWGCKHCFTMHFFSGSKFFRNSKFGKSAELPWMDNLVCSGYENDVTGCRFTWSSRACNDDANIGLECCKIHCFK